MDLVGAIADRGSEFVSARYVISFGVFYVFIKRVDANLFRIARTVESS